MQTLPHQLTAIIRDISKIAAYLWQREWAEKNSGNLSVDVSE